MQWHGIKIKDGDRNQKRKRSRDKTGKKCGSKTESSLRRRSYTSIEESAKSLLWTKFSMDTRRDFTKKFRRGILALEAAMKVVSDSAKKAGLPEGDMLALDDVSEIKSFIAKFKGKTYFSKY
jgi:hypothetical protein